MVIVPENERGQLTGEALQSALTRSHDVFAVVASAGTTNAGIIDDLTGIADVCERYGIWMHVDGAYGGAALAAPSVRHLFAGIERADSFIVDPHKWLFATYDCCALLYRQPELARAAHAQQAGYLDAIDREVWNPWDYGVHLTQASPRLAVLVQPCDAWHQPVRGGDRANPGNGSGGGKRDPDHPSAVIGLGAHTVCGAVRAAGMGR